MKHFAVIGSPVEYSLSPFLHNWFFKSLHLHAEYEKVRIENQELPDIIQKIKKGQLDGINVTIPHKEDIMQFLDEINPRAETIGSVNFMMKSHTRIIGNNTDWFGFSQALENNQIYVSVLAL